MIHQIHKPHGRLCRAVKCSAYIINKKYGSDTVAPFVADISVNDINSNGHFDLQHYVFYHIELYIMSFILISMFKYINKTLKSGLR